MLVTEAQHKAHVFDQARLPLHYLYLPLWSLDPGGHSLDWPVLGQMQAIAAQPMN